MRKYFIGIVVIACITVLAGCQTMGGAGRDIESAGNSIQRAAN